MLILVCGLPGSGKTTLSQELSGRINGISLNTDSIREELFETRTYSKQEKEKVYEKLLECSQKNLENEKNVVVDATFYKKELREKFISLANKLGKKSYLIYCFLDEEKTKIRLQNRKNDKSEADFSVYLKIKRCFEPIQKNYLQINTSENIQKQIEQVLFYIMKEQLKEKYQLIETHISLIFLDDTFAYKIKKPVKFSFLDFSTKEKRKFYLNEELRLNKKISPAIYLGIVDVNFQKDKFLIGNGGQSFELALKMKKIENKKKMDNLIQAGKISEKEIELLAKQISNFHQNAEIIKDFRYNSAQMLADQINDLGNFKKPINICCFMGKEVDFILEKCNKFIENNQDLLLKRQKIGKIKECHGDLHTGNIFFDKYPIIFDCIEFNNEFRFIDILSDVGFLAMDLDAKGQNQLSDFLIKKYALFSKDPDIEKLMPLYKCYRANVRAKIAAIEYEQKKDENNREKLELYLNLAEGYAKNL